MTQQETVKILMRLSAFYGEGKSDVRIMTEAWHELLQDYPYHVAKRAVMNFAKHDVRDYASFPTPGKIIEAVEAEMGVYNRIFNLALSKAEYEKLTDYEKRLIGIDRYEELRITPYEELLDMRENVISELKQNEIAMLPKGENE